MANIYQQNHNYDYTQDKFIHLNGTENWNSFRDSVNDEYDLTIYYSDVNGLQTRDFILSEYPNEIYAYFNTNSVLINQIEHSFQPTINSITPCNDIISYYVEALDKGASPGPTFTWSYNNLVLRGDRLDFKTYEHIMNGNGKFLTLFNSEYNRRVNLNSDYTLRTLNGDFKQLGNGDQITTADNFKSLFKYINIEVYDRNDTETVTYYYTTKLSSNPYYNQNYFIDEQPYNSYTSLNRLLLDLPSGPVNLNEISNLVLYRVQVDRKETGSTIPYTLGDNRVNVLQSNDIITSDTIYYDYYLSDGNISWIDTLTPNDMRDQKTSEVIRFELQECGIINSQDTIEVAWSNSLGGTDYFTMFGNNIESTKTLQKTYKTIDWKDSSGIREVNDYFSNEKVYDKDIESFILANTGYISNDDNKYLSGIINSEDIYLKKDGVWYSVIIQTNSMDNDNKIDKINNYRFEFKINKQLDQEYEHLSSSDFGIEILSPTTPVPTTP